MFKVEAIVREEALEDVKQALFDIDVRGITVSQVMGCGTQMGYTHYVRGSAATMTMLPKVKFEVVVSTDRMGRQVHQGHLWSLSFRDAWATARYSATRSIRAVRIRTGEEGVAAIQPGPPETDRGRIAGQGEVLSKGSPSLWLRERFLPFSSCGMGVGLGLGRGSPEAWSRGPLAASGSG